MDIPWFQRFLGKMDPFHIKFGLEGNGALEPWKFHGIEFQTSNIACNLAIMALDMLSIPAMSDEPERLFSGAGG
jgi:hypothetical protein